MKRSILLVMALLCTIAMQAQILKRIGNAVKYNMENRASSEINKAIDKKIDKALEKKKKKKGLGTDTTQVPPANDSTSAITEGMSAAKVDKPTNEGFAEIKLSDKKVFIGGTLTISGRSLNYGEWTHVTLSIAAPNAIKDYQVALDKDGRFVVDWIAQAYVGEYTATVKSSDGNATASEKFIVEYIDELEDLGKDNEAEVERAMKLITRRVEDTKKDLNAKQKATVDAKVKNLKAKADKLRLVFNDINKAGQLFAKAAGKGVALPENLSANISDLRQALHEHEEQTQRILDQVEHTTEGYSICETLEMVSEACAAFSTVTNFLGNFKKIAANIMADKVKPLINTQLNEYAFDKKLPNEAIVPPLKLITAASNNAGELMTDGGMSGVASDIAQLYSNIYLKELCTNFEGQLTHTYNVNFRNSDLNTWWKYGYTTKAKLTLRFPKSRGAGTTVTMKGHIEGNATDFSFFQDVAIEDEFWRTSKGHTRVTQLLLISPPAVPFATSQNDPAGFGMFARMAATPAYYNFPVDAVYDKENGTIRLFLTEGGVDFSPLVRNRVLLYSKAPLPMFRVQDFPIEKARKTIDAVIKRYGEYKVNDDGKGGLSFSGSNTHHAGDKGTSIETTVKLSLSANNN